MKPRRCELESDAGERDGYDGALRDFYVSDFLSVRSAARTIASLLQRLLHEQRLILSPRGTDIGARRATK